MKRFASVPMQRAAWQARWQALSPARKRGVVASVLVLLVLALATGFRQRIGGWLWPDPRAAELRTRAQQALRDGRLSVADGSGARELYEAALAIQPDQVEAREGLARVALAALAQAQAHLQAGRDGQARVALRLARALDAPRDRIEAVDAALRLREAAQAGVGALLAHADAARVAGHLDDGVQAALPLYRRVLALEPRNQRAVEGREDAITDLLQPAQVAMTAGDIGTLATLIRRAEAFDPGHVALPDLRAGLARVQEQLHARLREDLAKRRFERAMETCMQLAGTGNDGAMPAACTEGVLAGLLQRAEALAADFDFSGSAQVMAKARLLAPGDARVDNAERRLAGARQNARVLAPVPRARKQAVADAHRLLAEASRAQARGDWLTPPGDSAWDKLRAARALAPDDPAVRAAWTRMVPAARRCFEVGLRDNNLGSAGGCFDAWRQLDPADARLTPARRRLAQRWLAIGGERLEAGEVSNARHALDRARQLDPQSPGLADLAGRVERATQAQP